MSTMIHIKHNIKSLPTAIRMERSFSDRIEGNKALKAWSKDARKAHVSVKRRSHAKALAEFKKLNDVGEFYTSYVLGSDYRDDSIVVLWKPKSSAKRNPGKQKSGAKRKNPRTAINKGCGIPKGKRAGETFTKGGVKYRVVSYATKTGKRVRYARKV